MKAPHQHKHMLSFKEFDICLPIHSLFWEVEHFDENVQQVPLYSEFYNNNQFSLSELHKPLISPFYLNKKCANQLYL